MKYAKFLALRMIKITSHHKRVFRDACLISLFISTWGLIILSPWWYPSSMTPIEIFGVGAAIFSVALFLSPLVRLAIRRVNRPLRAHNVKITYDSHGMHSDSERLGYISAGTICKIGNKR